MKDFQYLYKIDKNIYKNDKTITLESLEKNDFSTKISINELPKKTQFIHFLLHEENKQSFETQLQYKPRLLRATRTINGEAQVIYVLGTCHLSKTNWIDTIKPDLVKILNESNITYIATELTSSLVSKKDIEDEYRSRYPQLAGNDAIYVMESEFIELVTDTVDNFSAYSLETIEEREELGLVGANISEQLLDKTMPIRDKNMVDKMIKINGSQLVAAGDHHLEGITSHLTAAGFSVEPYPLVSLEFTRPMQNRLK